MTLRLFREDPFYSPWDVMDRRMAQVANDVFRGLDDVGGGWGTLALPRVRFPAMDQGVSIKNDSDKFQVDMDVSHFTPEQLKVKVINDHLIVEGKHHQESDHGYESREFFRRIPLPDGVTPESVKSSLAHGKLQISAPKKALPGQAETPIPIEVHREHPKAVEGKK